VLNLSVFQTLKEKHEIEKAEILESSNKQFMAIVEEAMRNMDGEGRKTLEKGVEQNKKAMVALKELI